MPRPTTKTATLSESRKEYAALEQLLATKSPEEMPYPSSHFRWVMIEMRKGLRAG